MAFKGLKRMSGIYSGQLIFWIMPLARLAIVSLAFGDMNDSAGLLDHLIFFLWAIWAATTVMTALFSRPVHKPWLRGFWYVDIMLATLMILINPSSAGAVFAFGVCMVAAAASRFEQRGYIIASLAMPALAYPAGENFTGFILGQEYQGMHLWNPVLTLTLVLLAIVASVAASIRRGYLDDFRDICVGLKAQLSGNLLYHELQEWVDALASLYTPNKAFIALSPSSNLGQIQVSHCGFPMQGSGDDHHIVLAALQRLPLHCRIMDCTHNHCLSPRDRVTRAFTEDEEIIAGFLRKSGVRVALVQKVQVDKLAGGVICAVNAEPTPTLVAECPFLCGLFVETASYLDHKAKAERSFIADAHDVARRDLHDGVLQTLAALRMRLSSIAKKEDVNEHPVYLDIHKTIGIIALEQSRLRGLLEASSEGEKLVNLVTRLDVCARGISMQWDMLVAVISEEPAIPVLPEFALNIENLLREVVANAVRHTGSESLTITLSLKHDALLLVVKDLTATHEKTGRKVTASMPLKSVSLRQRLQLVNGEAYAVGLEQSDLLAIRIPMEHIEDA